MDEEQNNERPPVKRIGRILLIVLLVMICLFCILVLTGALIFHHYYSLIEYEEVDPSVPPLTDGEISEILDHLYGDESLLPAESEMAEDSREALDASMEEVIDQNNPNGENSNEEEEPDLSHILVLGMDVNDSGSRARSDTMIVVSINEETGRIVLTSLLRDIYLSIPDYPNNRLNAAFSFGNVALLQKTIAVNFGIEIDKYIAIDFSAFTDIIDILNGIELTLTEQDCTHVFPGQNKTGGVYTLNGEQALMYARWRYGASDFERTERQRTVMVTVINRMLKMSLSELTTIMGEILPKVRTDLTELNCYSILLHVGNLADYEISTARIPFAGTWEYATIDRKSVLTLDLEENRRLFFENVLGIGS